MREPPTVASLRDNLTEYLKHVVRFGRGRECGCEELSCDESCDRGAAMWRMQAREYGHPVRPVLA